jgi:hypothetical protein
MPVASEPVEAKTPSAAKHNSLHWCTLIRGDLSLSFFWRVNVLLLTACTACLEQSDSCRFFSIFLAVNLVVGKT